MDRYKRKPDFGACQETGQGRRKENGTARKRNGRQQRKERRQESKPTPSHPPPHQVTWGQVTGTLPPSGERGGPQIVAGTSGGRGRGQLKIQLMIQRVQDVRGEECTVLWDSGAQVSLVTHEYARGAGFRRRSASIRITGVGAGS